MIYTTNTIKSVNYQLRKATKNRGHFPNERSALKLLYPPIRNIDTKRKRPQPTNTQGPKARNNQPATRYPQRLPTT